MHCDLHSTDEKKERFQEDNELCDRSLLLNNKRDLNPYFGTPKPMSFPTAEVVLNM